ncbi:MAG: hypothetical protein HUK21_06390 [Fibrobacteraceae bacterium]|nr:hypothetical protein [Fibrobacteraceae bacterium]
MQYSAHIFIGTHSLQFAQGVCDKISGYPNPEVLSHIFVQHWSNSNKDSFIVNELFNPILNDKELQKVSADSAYIKNWFSIFHDKAVNTETVKSIADGGQICMALHICLSDPKDWETAKQIIGALNHRDFKLDLIAYAPDVEESYTNTPIKLEQLEEKNKIGKDQVKQIINFKQSINQNTSVFTHFILLQNKNKNGLSKNFDFAKLSNTLFEFCILYSEIYYSIFTKAEDSDPEIPIVAIGLSVADLDPQYIVNYLHSQTYLHCLKEENVSQNKVDINKAYRYAKECIGDPSVFSTLWSKKVSLLLNSNLPQEKIAEEIAPEVNKLEQSKLESLEGFLTNPELTLPEKEAVLAMILGVDCKLLTGSLYSKNIVNIDDFVTDVTQYFVNLEYAPEERVDVASLLEEKKILSIERIESEDSIKNLETQNKNLNTTQLNIETKDNILNDCSIETNTLLDETRINQNINKKNIQEEKDLLGKKQLSYISAAEHFNELQSKYIRKANRKNAENIATTRFKEEKESLAAKKEETSIRRDDAIAQYNSKIKSYWIKALKIGLTLFAIYVALFAFYYYTRDGFDILQIFGNKYSYIPIIGMVITLLVTLVIHKYLSDCRNKVRKEFNQEITNIENQIGKKVREIEETHLKANIAGLVLDKLAELKGILSTKFTEMDLFIDKMVQWKGEEEKKVSQMTPKAKTPYMPIVKNNLLEKFFESNKMDLTKDIALYQRFTNFPINEEGLNQFKNQMEQMVKEALKKPLKAYSAYEYFAGETKYDFLDCNQGYIQEIITKLEASSMPFLQYNMDVSDENHPENSLILIQTENELQKQKWQEICTQYLSSTPAVISVKSTNKLILLKTQRLKAESITFMSEC